MRMSESLLMRPRTADADHGEFPGQSERVMDTRRVDGGRGPGRANPGFVLAVLLLAMADPGPIRGGDETPRAPSPARTGPVEESPQSPGTGGITAGLAELPSEVEWSIHRSPGPS